MVHHDFGFVNTIVRGTTADRGRATSVNVELKAKDGVASTSLIKAVPIFLDEGSDLGCERVRWFDGLINVEAFIELYLISSMVSLANIGARRGKVSWFSMSSAKSNGM